MSQPSAWTECPRTGVRLELWTAEPGLQVFDAPRDGDRVARARRAVVRAVRRALPRGAASSGQRAPSGLAEHHPDAGGTLLPAAGGGDRAIAPRSQGLTSRRSMHKACTVHAQSMRHGLQSGVSVNGGRHAARTARCRAVTPRLLPHCRKSLNSSPWPGQFGGECGGANGHTAHHRFFCFRHMRLTRATDRSGNGRAERT